MTVLTLNDTDAQLFLEFRRLQSTGVFDVKNGSVTLHFDKQGVINAIEKKEMLRLS